MHYNTNDLNKHNTVDSTNKNKKVLLTKKELILTLCFTALILAPLFFLVVIYDNAAATVIKKPIIYLYPTEETQVSVNLGNPNNLICSYPKYEDSWNVIAKPNGDLVDLKTGRNLYSLYWEGKNNHQKAITEGFCVKGADSSKFLEEKLAVLGLSDREAEEFIVYWLPILESNKYNLISFESMEEMNNDMPLSISPTPDSIIRVMMKFKGVNKYIEIPKQQLQTPQRTGFVAVEWGGTEIK